jgi:hypothetical protein
MQLIDLPISVSQIGTSRLLEGKQYHLALAVGWIRVRRDQ